MIRQEHKHIIWDWNGTLVNDTVFCTELLNESLRKYSLPEISVDHYRETFHFPVKSFYEQLGFWDARVSFEEISLIFIESYRAGWKHCQLHTNAMDLFNLCQKKGISQSVLSASKQEPLEEYISHFSINHYFTDLVGVNHHYASSKVDEGKIWLDRHHLRAEEMVLVGDTAHDYEVAQELGTDCILVAHGHYHKDRLLETGATVVESFAELYDYLLNHHEAI
jgi:phosphoglycolate phosphatase